MKWKNVYHWNYLQQCLSHRFWIFHIKWQKHFTFVNGYFTISIFVKEITSFHSGVKTFFKLHLNSHVKGVAGIALWLGKNTAHQLWLDFQPEFWLEYQMISTVIWFCQKKTFVSLRRHYVLTLFKTQYNWRKKEPVKMKANLMWRTRCCLYWSTQKEPKIA